MIKDLNKKTVLALGDISCFKKIQNKYFLRTATDIEEGISLLNEFSDEIALILIEGRKAVEGNTLRELCDDKKQPVVVVDDSLSDAEKQLCIENGASDFVCCSTNDNILQKRLDNLIRLYEIECRLKRVSVDELTGIYNKPFFMDYMTQQIRTSNQTFDLVCLEMESYDLLHGRYGGEICDSFMTGMVKGLAEFIPIPITMGRIDGAHVVFMLPSVPFEMHVQMMQNCIMIGKQAPMPFFTANAGVYHAIPKNVTAEEVYNGCLMAIKGIRYKHDTFIAEYNDEIRQCKRELWVVFYLQSNKIAFEYQSVIF